ncbi:MAG: helix-turn-helix domain-containing protein [Ktedonobacterales bacterium]|nr:helix-turn-helix domain-containing protein [Ktedonobacterales bacterium]
MQNPTNLSIPKRFFTIVEVAKMLHVSDDTVRRMLRGDPRKGIAPSLRAIQVSPRIRRIPVEAINEFTQRGMALNG